MLETFHMKYIYIATIELCVSLAASPLCLAGHQGMIA